MSRPSLAGMLLVVALCGCTTTPASMSRWVGTNRADLLSQWGAPDGEAPLRDGRNVVTWTSQWGLWILGSTCRQSFTLDQQDVVREWSYSRCLPVQVSL
jgi:hypothetical protein